MIPPASPDNWSFDEAGKWLARHPGELEPGLRLLDRGLDLGNGLVVPLCGVDPLGRPCLILHSRKFSPHFFDQLLEIVARLTSDGRRFHALFPRPTEPRVFLMATSFDRDVRQRLALLGKAFPLRLFLLLPPLSNESEPQLIPEQLGSDADARSLASVLPASIAPLFDRLLRACSALHPEVVISGNEWPLILNGGNGPCAALHFFEDELWFACSCEKHREAPQRIVDDAAVDDAIDDLMRGQSNGVSPAA